MEKYVDFVNDYTEATWMYHEDDTLLRVCIDGYPEDDTKSGTVIATVSLTRRKDLVVDWHRNDYRLNERVKALIDETKIMLLQQYDQFAAVAMNTEKKMAEFADKKDLDYVLTSYGKEKVKTFIKDCAAKRKETLDAGIDTADETNLPSEEDILSDLNCGEYIDEDGDYYNGWGVTDHYDSDAPISLRYGIDFVCKLGTKVILKSTGKSGVIIGICDLNSEDLPFGFVVLMDGKGYKNVLRFAEEFEPVLE